jgi:hypothetical protein
MESMARMTGLWAWAVPGAAAAAAMWRRRAPLEEAAWTAAVAGVWLAASLATGDRRLYFPFSMQLAAQGACVSKPLGAGMVALFAVVRLLQGATRGVLMVELLVAAAALGAGLWINSKGESTGGMRVAAGTAGALVALCGLAL